MRINIINGVLLKFGNNLETNIVSHNTMKLVMLFNVYYFIIIKAFKTKIHIITLFRFVSVNGSGRKL